MHMTKVEEACHNHILKKIDKYEQCIFSQKPLLNAKLYHGRSLNKVKIFKRIE